MLYLGPACCSSDDPAVAVVYGPAFSSASQQETGTGHGQWHRGGFMGVSERVQSPDLIMIYSSWINVICSIMALVQSTIHSCILQYLI